ncbi:hypothetical protein H4R33_005181 [Dimargaris cristalligena]|nr:hypothetical protein H4R33_005181 [Dimargaris cristalligena]
MAVTSKLRSAEVTPLASVADPMYKNSPLARNCSELSLPSSFDTSYFSDSSLEEPASPLSLSFIDNCNQYLSDSSLSPALSSPPLSLSPMSLDTESSASFSTPILHASPSSALSPTKELHRLQSDLATTTQSTWSSASHSANSAKQSPTDSYFPPPPYIPMLSSSTSSGSPQTGGPPTTTVITQVDRPRNRRHLSARARGKQASTSRESLASIVSSSSASSLSNGEVEAESGSQGSDRKPRNAAQAHHDTSQLGSVETKPNFLDRFLAPKKGRRNQRTMSEIGNAFNPAVPLEISHPENPGRVGGLSEKVKGSIINRLGNLLGKPQWEAKGELIKEMGQGEMEAARALKQQQLFS